MNVLAIDHGQKRIGLAWVDTDLGVVLPYGVFKNDDKILNNLSDFVANEKVHQIVIGLPIGLDGQENDNTKHVRSFVNELKGVVSVPIEFVDERFTSRQADQMGGDASRDEKAAMLLLESFINKRK